MYKLISIIIKKIFSIYLLNVAKRHLKKRKDNSFKPTLLFGTTPIINNKYWANAMKEIGYESFSVMAEFYSINKKNDYDLYFADILAESKFKLKYFCADYVVFYFLVKKFDIVHIPCNGMSFQDKWLKSNEIKLLKLFGCKIVVLPYGSDFYQYSKIPDISWRHVLQINYPNGSFVEQEVEKNIKVLTIKADTIISGLQTEGIGRWDLFPYNIVSIDVNAVNFSIDKYSLRDGKNGVVRVVHTPNHRFIKGTEFVISAVNQLKSEGLLIELILLENKTNDEVLKVLATKADIVVEQLVLGYALSAMEAMSCGVPVLSNLDNESHNRAFRRYSYLNECPILSTNPENIVNNLRIMVLNPGLRKEMGIASRAYVEKYHSNRTIQYVFEKVYSKIWGNNEEDLLNMFHPLNPHSYNNLSPKIKHPLFENKISEQLLSTLNN
jgi:glycosyltransferase involved in cell wall biosynthesis